MVKGLFVTENDTLLLTECVNALMSVFARQLMVTAVRQVMMHQVANGFGRFIAPKLRLELVKRLLAAVVLGWAAPFLLPIRPCAVIIDVCWDVLLVRVIRHGFGFSHVANRTNGRGCAQLA